MLKAIQERKVSAELFLSSLVTPVLACTPGVAPLLDVFLILLCLLVISWLNTFLFFSSFFFLVNSWIQEDLIYTAWRLFLPWLHRVVGRCRKCMKLDNDARLRHDFSQYRAMLKELRRSEGSFEDGSKIANLLQVGIHARCFGIRETETTTLICIFKSFAAVKTNQFLPLVFFFNITVSLTF